MPQSPPRVRLAEVSPPIALGPLDGRYRAATAALVEDLSEAGLNRARIEVEIAWFIHLAQRQALPGLPTLTEESVEYLRAIPAAFGPDEIAELGEIERQTVHDVKAVEYFIRRRLESASAPAQLRQASLAELVHFGATSEDINNLAYALTVRRAVGQVWLPAARELVADLAQLAQANADVAMLSRTHGQPATPTTLGKEMGVIAHRLDRQLRRIMAGEYLGKMSGATGTYGAHVVAAPDTDWPAVARSFVESLGLTWNPLTTQIESHDWQAELYGDIARFNRIAHNAATDFWTYISLGYFAQVRGHGSVGSSTMPHKVNPIRFENAEANLELSCALLDTLAATLVTSRLQRDLTDSTTQRNIGVALGHSLLAIDNLRRGLAGLDVDRSAIGRDLESAWEVLAEPIQSAMRAAAIAGVQGMENPYERLKELTRGKQIDAETLRDFLATLNLPADAVTRLAALTPSTYTGLAAQLTRQYTPKTHRSEGQGNPPASPDAKRQTKEGSL